MTWPMPNRKEANALRWCQRCGVLYDPRLGGTETHCGKCKGLA